MTKKRLSPGTEWLVAADGHRLAVDQLEPLAPDAPWLLCLHGLGSDRRGEKIEFLGALAQEHGLGLVAFDFRGHGESGGELSELTLTRQLEDIDTVVSELRKRHETAKLIAVGSSLGALSSCWYSARHPGQFAGQLLLAPAFQLVERRLARLNHAQLAQWQEQGMFRFQGPWMSFDLSYALVQELTQYSHDDLVAQTSIPTVILHGTQDESVPVELSRAFARNCPAIRRLVEIKQGDHRLTDHVETIGTTLLEFLDELS